MSVTINYTAPNCPGFNSGLATAQVAGGAAPYNYYWSNGQTGQTISNPANGALSVTVTDANYATASHSTSIVVPSALNVQVAGAPNPCLPGSNFLTANVSGGTGPYNYAWSNGGNGATIANLYQSGYYFVTITDNNGCVKVGGAAFNMPMSVNVITHPSKCGGTCDGSVEAKVNNGTAPFSYQWSSGPTPTSWIQGPTPENFYTITVTDGNGCTATGSAFLDDPDPITTNFTASNPCDAPTNVTAAATGGTPPYNYQWANGQAGATAYALQQGNYVMVVTDANGCAKDFTATVSAPGNMALATQSTPSACVGQGGGTATVTPTGGAGTYTYAWSNGQTTATATNLAAGSYTVTVSDNSGCSKTTSVNVTAATSFTAAVQTTDWRCEGTEGTATVTISGGNGASYSYQWSGGQGNGNAAGDFAPGSYTVTVTGTDGCAQVVDFVIEDVSIQLSANYQAASCTDNGSAQVSVSNANGALTYQWSNGGTGASQSNLAPGSYTVTVTDALGCEESLSVEVDDAAFEVEMEALQQGCADEPVGVVQASIVGGTANAAYTYQWSNFGQSNTIGGLLPGQYSVTVSDQSGCEQVATFNLTSSPAIDLDINLLNASCQSLANGNVELAVVGGATPFSYQWSTGSTNQTASNLAAGAYTVVVTDANGCTKAFDVLMEDENLAIELLANDPTCANTPDGSMSVDVVSGGTAPFSYQWSNGTGTETLQNIAAGSFSVTVTDANGCQAQQTVEVAAQFDLDADFAWAATDCDDNGVTVQFNSQSSNAATWEWTTSTGQVFNGPNPEILVEQSPMTVQLTVTSAQGCQATASQTVEAAPLSLSLEDNVQVCKDQDVEFNLQVNNPTGGALTYDWQPANLVVSGQGTPNPVFASAVTGPVNVTVAVSNGSCIANDQALMDVVDAITVDPAAISYSHCQDMMVNFTNNSGVNGTWYFQYPSQTFISNEINPSFNYGQSGNYSVSFVPDGACSVPVYLVVALADAPQVSFEVSAADCNEPVSVVFTNTSNVSISDFYWDFGPLGTSTEANPTLTVSGSQVVNAQLVATYGNGCQQTVTDQVAVESFLPPTLQAAVHACEAGATVELNPAADPGFIYEWAGANIAEPNAVNPVVSVGAATTYSVVITAPNGCSSTQFVTVEVPSEPLEIAPMADVIACDTDPIMLLAQTNQSNVTFVWASDESYDFVVGTEQSLQVQSGNQPITYYVLATDEFGCTAQTSVTVQNAALDIDFDNAFEVCKGHPLNLQVDIEGVTASDFTNWTPFNPLNTPLSENGTFFFSVTNDLGCVSTGQLTVKVVEFNGTLAVAAEPTEVWAGTTTQLSVTENANYEYLWSPLLGLSDPFGPNPVATPEGNTTYTVEVTDKSTGCRSTAEVEVKVKDIICDEPYIYLPNAFTPNADGINDLLKVEGFNVEEVYLAIYNRWGEKVFETNSMEQGWDGTFRGATVSGDVYGYYLKVKCPGGLEFFKKGNITVLR